MADLKISPDLCASVAGLWDSLQVNEDDLHSDNFQDSFRSEVIECIGDAWAELLRAIRAELASAPYTVVIRGAEVDMADKILSTLAACIGRMTNPYRGIVPGMSLLQEIFAKGPASPDRVWLWHTDSANWQRPNDYSAFACVRAAPVGGATETLCLDTVSRSARVANVSLARLADDSFPWPVERVLGGGVVYEPVISSERLRFRRELLLSSAESSYWDVVSEFAELIDGMSPDATSLLKPGDMLIFDNRKVMHRSGPVTDPQGNRLLLRTKINARSVTQ